MRKENLNRMNGFYFLERQREIVFVVLVFIFKANIGDHNGVLNAWKVWRIDSTKIIPIPITTSFLRQLGGLNVHGSQVGAIGYVVQQYE